MRDLIILGAGGYARETMALINRIHKYRIINFYDETIAEGFNITVHSIPVIKSLEKFRKLPPSNRPALISAVGNPTLKKRWAEEFTDDFEFITVIDPDARIGPNIKIGVGSIITSGCILTVDVVIGNHVNINLNCTIGHDSVIGDFCDLAPACNISGNVTIKEGVSLGTGAIVIPKKIINAWSVVGAGAVVVSDIPEKVVAVGVPAKIIKTIAI